jgi:hypothetical protein
MPTTEPRLTWNRAAFRKLQPGTRVVYLPDGMTGTVAPEGFAWLGLWIEWDDQESGPSPETEWPKIDLCQPPTD